MNTSDYEYAIDVLTGMVEGTVGPYDWDDFISIKSKDRFLDAVRITSGHTRDIFPPEADGEYTNPVGLEVLALLADILKKAIAYNSARR